MGGLFWLKNLDEHCEKSNLNMSFIENPAKKIEFCHYYNVDGYNGVIYVFGTIFTLK